MTYYDQWAELERLAKAQMIAIRRGDDDTAAECAMERHRIEAQIREQNTRRWREDGPGRSFVPQEVSHYRVVKILSLLKEQPLQTYSIAHRLGEPVDRVRSIMYRLRKKGAVTNTNGVWEISA